MTVNSCVCRGRESLPVAFSAVVCPVAQYIVRLVAVVCTFFHVHTLVAGEWIWDNGSGITYLAEKNADGTAYQFKFLTIPGVSYSIQSSDDLTTWTDDVIYRGIGHTITHPLFPIPQNDGSNPAPVADPEGYVPPINGSFRIKEINIDGLTTGLHVEWVSLDDELPKSYVLHGEQIDEDMPPLFYSRDFDEYSLLIQFMGEITNPNDVPPNDTLGTKDSALIGKLLDSLPAINADITANNAAQAASPPPPPMEGGKKFYRIRQFFTDTDQDGIQDHIEEQQGLNMWNWDTDGDGISDSQDQNPLVNDAVANPDGSGLPASLDNGLLARYDFETLQGGYPNQTFEDKSGNNRHANSRFMGIDSLGMVSKAAKTNGFGFAKGDGATFQGLTDYALSFWVCLDKDSVKNSTTGSTHGLYGVYDYLWELSPQNRIILQYDLRGLRIEKSASGEELWKLGGFSYDNDPNDDGYPDLAVATVEYGTMSFTQPQGTTDDGNWHHIAVVRKHPHYRVYIDGVLKKQEQKPVMPLAHVQGITDFCFGRWMEHLPNTQLQGKFDRMRIYGRALTAVEVDALYHQDVDNDGLFDREEVKSLLWRDTNGDGIRTNAESFYTVNPFRWDPPDSDHDHDGLPSLAEQNTHGTDMTNPDTDRDLMPDGWEVVNGLNPLWNDANADADLDGLLNIDEFVYKSNPQLVNTDGGNGKDDANDLQEVLQGSNPHDDSDGGNPIPPEEKLTIKLGVGDQSGSESEDYVLNVFRLNPETGEEEPFYTLRSGGHGQYVEKILSIFKKSDSYAFQIDWQSSNLGNSGDPNNPEGADFDYTLVVEPQNDDTGILVDSYDPRTRRINESEPITGGKNDVEDFKQKVEPVRVANIVVDLDIVKPDDDSKEIAEDKEETEGEVVPLNADDDDDDGGAGGHGQNVIIVDKDDVNGVEGEDDLIKIKLKKTAVANGKFRLAFDNTHIRLWEKPNKTKSVTSDQTEFPTDKETIVYVEGIKPNSDLSGTLISLKAKFGGGAFAVKDKVKIHVARPMFLVFGHEHPAPANIDNYFETVSKDERLDPYIIKGKRNNQDVYYSMLYGESEKLLKVALSTQDAHVMFTGHSNFGLGPAFGNAGYTKLTDFMNVGGQGRASIDVDYFHQEQGHPLLQVGNNDYIQSPKNYNVPYVPADCRERFPNSAGVGIGQTFTLTQIAPPLHPSRYYKLGDHDRVIVTSSGDIPTLRYESFFFAGCNSGRDFIESFQHGAFFYTRKCPLIEHWEDERDFFDSIIKGKTWAQTKAALNTGVGDNGMYSYHQF